MTYQTHMFSSAILPVAALTGTLDNCSNSAISLLGFPLFAAPLWIIQFQIRLEIWPYLACWYNLADTRIPRNISFSKRYVFEWLASFGIISIFTFFSDYNDGTLFHCPEYEFSTDRSSVGWLHTGVALCFSWKCSSTDGWFVSQYASQNTEKFDWKGFRACWIYSL